MATLTELVSEPRKMRASFLVLFGLIVIYSNNTHAKAVKFVIQDEINSITENSVEGIRRNDSNCATIQKKSDANGEDHIVRKRQISADSSKIVSLLSKKPGGKPKIGPHKVKYGGHKAKIVPDNIYSIKKGKYGTTKDISPRRTAGFNTWYIPDSRRKPYSIPVIYSVPKEYNTWNTQTNVQSYIGGQDHHAEPRFLPTLDILKLGELTEVIRNSVKDGVDCLFDSIEKELKRRLLNRESPAPDTSAITRFNTRSSCIDTGDGSCEDESTDDTSDTVSPNECKDDAPAPSNASNNAVVANDIGKRSDSSVDPIKEALPSLVKALESILSQGIDNKMSVAKGSGDEDDENDDNKLGSRGEAADAAAEYGHDNARSLHWDPEDINSDNAE